MATATITMRTMAKVVLAVMPFLAATESRVCLQDQSLFSQACRAGMTEEEFCTKNVAICQKVCAESTLCIDSNNPKCKACQAGMPVTKYCGIDASRPGCKDICCDEGCSATCEKTPVGNITVKATCKWRVVDKLYEVFAPVILETEIEQSCPIEDHFKLHLQSCQACAALNKPCEDQYMACGGCCGTKFHESFGLDVKTKHECDEVKQFFKVRNSLNVECEEEAPFMPPADKHAVSMEVSEPDAPEEILDEGIIEDECKSEVNQLHCNKIPAKLKFECDACGMEGSPELLSKCCEKCVEWIESLDENPNIPNRVKAFGWCSGCQATHIDSGFEGVPLMEWKDAGKFEAYAEKYADTGMDDYLDEHVCKLLTPSCDAVTTTTTTKLFLGNGNDVSVSLNPIMCMTPGAKCGPGQRTLGRLLTAEVEAEDWVSDDPDTSCEHFDKESYPSHPVEEDGEATITTNSTDASDGSEQTTTGLVLFAAVALAHCVQG